jgi:hypothetical protein
MKVIWDRPDRQVNRQSLSQETVSTPGAGFLAVPDFARGLGSNVANGLEEPANLAAAIGANDVRYASHGRVQNLNANLIALSCAIANFRPDVVVLRGQPKGL